MITDQTGAVVYKTEYTAYGEHIPEKTTGTRSTHFTYTSQEEDDTGLMYYGARYYDAETGRFAQADTVIDGAFSTQGWNRYMYVHGNPINWTDPTGMNAKDGLNGKGQSSVRDHKGKHHGGGSTTPQQLRERRLREQRRREQQANQDKYGGQGGTTGNNPLAQMCGWGLGCGDVYTNPQSGNMEKSMAELIASAEEEGIEFSELEEQELEALVEELSKSKWTGAIYALLVVVDSLMAISGISKAAADGIARSETLASIIEDGANVAPDISSAATVALTSQADALSKMADRCGYMTINAYETNNHHEDFWSSMHDHFKNMQYNIADILQKRSIMEGK